MKLKNAFTIIVILLIVLITGCKKDDTNVVSKDSILPTVTSTHPANNATGVIRSKAITLTFSKAMNPLTINASTITLMQGTTSVSGSVAYSGKTATFTPTNTLASDLTYTATITSGAKDFLAMHLLLTLYGVSQL